MSLEGDGCLWQVKGVSGRHLGGVVWLPAGGREDVLVPLVPLPQDHLEDRRLAEEETGLLAGEGAGQGGARSRRSQEGEVTVEGAGWSRAVTGSQRRRITGETLPV